MNCEKWQDRFQSERIAELSMTETRKISAIWELIKTEKDYVRDLHSISEVFC